jgi:hypothetical protein
VPDAYVQQVLAAGSVCPVVTPPRIAAQLMAQSGFNPNKLSSAGQEGVAQFRIQEWSFYNVKPEATPWEPGEAILVLGRAMCDLVNQVGTANRTADPYAGALTAYEWGVTSVAQAGGVPADADRSLIAQVNGYLPYYTADRRLSPATPAAGRPVAPPPPPAPPNPRPSVTAPPPAPGTHGAYAPIQAESHTAESGSTVESCTDTGGGQDVGHLSTGDWLTYDKVDFGSDGAGRFLVRLASGLPSGMSGLIEVRLDAQTNAPVGSAAVSGTGGWQSWMTVPANISRVTGVHTVYLTFVSSSGWEIANINWFTFEH